MTAEDRIFLSEINLYAEKVLADIDPEKTHVSEQLEKLRPVMERLAKKHDMPLEDIFIKYMDLASEFRIEEEQKYKAKMGPDFDLNFKI